MINNSSIINASSTKKKVFFPNLDGLRSVAFLAVFLIHSFYTEYNHITQSDVYQTVKFLVSQGNLGVNLFFVLSGFLITFLLLNEEEVTSKINVPYFYFRRFLRIWPLYFACVAFGFIIEPYIKQLTGQTPNEIADPLLFVTFLSNFNNIINGGADAQNLPILWSVAVEEQFYLIWPLLLIFFRKNRVLLCILIILASIIFRLIHADNSSIIYYHTFSVISDLAFGGLIAWLCYYSKTFIDIVRHISTKDIVLLYVLGFIYIGIRKEVFDTPFLLSIRRLITSFFFAFIILEQNYAKYSPFKLGSNKLLTFWGKYTYGLYCLHFIGITIAKQLCKIIGIADTLWGVLVWQTILSLLISMLLSYISYEYFEKYFLRLKDKYAFITK